MITQHLMPVALGRRTSRPTLACGLVGAALLAGCMAGPEPAGEDLVRERRPDRTVSSDSACTAEPSDPSARGTLVLDGDPSRATAVTVAAMNRRDESLLIGARLRTRIGGKARSIDVAPVLVRPGAGVEHRVELRELGALASALELPARIDATLVVHGQDGALLERVSLEAVTVGPDLRTSLAPLLKEARIAERDLTRLRDSKLKLTIAAADKGDHGLTADELKGPAEDGGSPLDNPTYSDAKPDANGEYHYDFCFRWPVSFVDAGFGESYGIDEEGAWRARGGRMTILSHGKTLFDDYLDANGCTGVITTTEPTDYWFVGHGLARINGNDVIAKAPDGTVDTFVRVVPMVGGSGTKHYTLPETDRSNLLAVTTFTLARFESMTGGEYIVNDRCRPDGDQCCDCASGGEIWVTRKTRKFLIAHEVGHHLLSLHTGGYNNDCTLGVASNHPCFNSSSHAIDSLEHISCAAMEGWAHFVAVRAFNDHQAGDDPGATFRYWRNTGLTVDVEQGPAGGLDRYYETLCGGNAANSAGMGVELDWLRAWWDYHTDPAPGNKPGLPRMLDEIANSAGWWRNDTYDFLVDGIEGWSGAAQRDRWTQIAADNGIDH